MRLMVTLIFMLLACGDKQEDTSIEEVEEAAEEQDSGQDSGDEVEDLASQKE